jgi:hypothetical protein
MSSNPAPAGTQITALVGGKASGSVTTTVAGSYEALIVQGQIADGDPISFTLNNAAAECSTDGSTWTATYPFRSGDAVSLDLRTGGSPTPPPTTPTTPTPSTPTPTPTPTPDLLTIIKSVFGGSFMSQILKVVVIIIIVTAGAFYFLRKRRPPKSAEPSMSLDDIKI